MAYLLILLSFLAPSFSMASSGPKEAVFSFHLLGEPMSADPSTVRGASGAYLFNNIYSSLFRYHSEKGLIPEGARKCFWRKKKLLICQLNKSMRFSDGSPIYAKHYVYALEKLFSKKTKTLETSHWLSLKNAVAVLKGQTPFQQLGIKATQKFQLSFQLEESYPDFIYNLTYPSFTAIKKKGPPLSTGPYMIKKWDRGRAIHLTKNPHYFRSSPRPPVKAYIIESDETALRLFEANKLSLVRRMDTIHRAKYKNHPGFFQVPLHRFDYIGFGPKLSEHKYLRKALALSLNYPELQKLYNALGVPGCPSISSKYFLDKSVCHHFQLLKAKQALKKNQPLPKKIKLQFSTMAGNEVARGMEWIQHQWSKHIGVNIELNPIEQKIALRNLRVSPPDIFRKGVNLNDPNCYSGLEIFSKKNPENYISYNNPKYEKLLEKLKNSKTSIHKKKLCHQALKILAEDYVIIPMGEIHYSMLHNQKFSGWSINGLNQLDLSLLKTN